MIEQNLPGFEVVERVQWDPTRAFGPKRGYGPQVEDYYDPFPRMQLARPIVLGGQIGCGARLVARSLCARTGLPFVDVDRQIEHEAGASLDQLAQDQSPGRIAHWARMILERHSIQRPWSVIALDRAWPTSEVTPLLRRKVDFVHIQRTPDFLLPRMRKVLGVKGAWVAGGMTESIGNITEMNSLLERRSTLLAEAGILLDAGSRHELEIAAIVQESLDSVAQGVAF